MHIYFSQELLKGLICYLNLDIRILVDDEAFPYSKTYLYKVLDGTIAINNQTNQALNRLWYERSLTSEDLSNVYTLIDILNEGKAKETYYQVRKGENYEVSK